MPTPIPMDERIYAFKGTESVKNFVGAIWDSLLRV